MGQSWHKNSHFTYASWMVSPGVQSESQGSVTARCGCTLTFQARRVSSQDWGHKEATKFPLLYIRKPPGSLMKAGPPELDEERVLPSHLPAPGSLPAEAAAWRTPCTAGCPEEGGEGGMCHLGLGAMGQKARDPTPC